MMLDGIGIIREERIGSHRLILSDCLEVMRQLPRPEVIITDPPYGMAYTPDRRGAGQIVNDGARISLRLYRKLAPLIAGIPTLWFTRWDIWPDVWEIFAQTMKINGLLVWDKDVHGMGNCRHWSPSYELIASMGGIRLRGYRDRSVLRYSPVAAARRVHQNEKPLSLIEYLIGKTTDPAALVVDPFMGSGTTIAACERLGRRGIGIEIDPDHFDAACARIEKEVQNAR